MQLLWAIILVAFFIAGLSIVRAIIFNKWRLKAPLETAMEFSSFTAKPHPVPTRFYSIIFAELFFIASMVVFRVIENDMPSIILLLLGMIFYFIYDLSGASERTNITVLPDAIYFESAKDDKRPFLLPFVNIERVDETATGFTIILKPNKFINRIPLKCKNPPNAIAEIKKYYK